MISLQTQEEKKKAEKKQNQANIIRNKSPSPSSIIDVAKCYETMHVTFVDDDVNCDDQLAPPLR